MMDRSFRERPSGPLERRPEREAIFFHVERAEGLSLPARDEAGRRGKVGNRHGGLSPSNRSRTAAFLPFFKDGGVPRISDGVSVAVSPNFLVILETNDKKARCSLKKNPLRSQSTFFLFLPTRSSAGMPHADKMWQRNRRARHVQPLRAVKTKDPNVK